MNFYEQIAANKRRTWFLIIIFILFIAGFAWVLAESLRLEPAERIGILGFFGIMAIIFPLVSYYSGSKIALISSGAKEAPREGEYLELHRLVENLAMTVGMPKPKVYVIKDPSPNAFATGRSPENAAIAVTTGLLELLERRELEGVVAHELAHIRNYDIRLMTIVVVLVGFVALISDIFMRSLFYGGSRRRSNNKGGGALVIIAIVLSILSPIIAKLIQLAISRKREYLADASGVQMTRYSEGLASALEKITQDDTKLKRAGTATAHLYIASPFSAKKKKSFLKAWFSTHPDPAERIARLRGQST
jgi:heat shock protein HtpX